MADESKSGGGGGGDELEYRRVPRWIFLRLLGVVHIVAFASLWVQIHGLIGEGGVVPVARTLQTFTESITIQGSLEWWRVPSLAWIASGDIALHVYCFLGVVLGGLLAYGRWAPRLMLLGLWMLYLSVSVVAGPFMNGPWDHLLLETTLLAIAFAPGAMKPTRAAEKAPSPWALWLVRLLLFKFMFTAGLAKLAATGTSWTELTAFKDYVLTQPLPNALSWWFYHRPEWMLSTVTVLVLFVQLVGPFLIIFNPRSWRMPLFFAVSAATLFLVGGQFSWPLVVGLVLMAFVLDDRVLARIAKKAVPEGPEDVGSRLGAFILFAGFSIGAMVVGSGGFLPLLVFALSFTLLDDGALERALPAKLFVRFDAKGGPAGYPAHGLALALGLLFLSATTLQIDTLLPASDDAAAEHPSLFTRARTLNNAWRVRFHEPISQLASIHLYEVFTEPANERWEAEIQGRLGGKQATYDLKWRPKKDGTAPPYALFHLPRLEWALYDMANQSTCRGQWLVGLQRQLVERAPSVVGLVAGEAHKGDITLSGIQIRRARYDFVAPKAHKKGQSWRRTKVENFCGYASAAALKDAKPMKTQRAHASLR